MRTRAERRETSYNKWISKLKSVFNSGYRTIIMPIKTSKWFDYKNAKTFDELKEDKYGVLLKNTKTICSDKDLTIKEEHKRNVNNRVLNDADKEELNEIVGDNNIINL